LPRPQKFSQPIALAARLRYDDRMRHCRRRKKKRMLGQALLELPKTEVI
jgi:hypothetical protein